jgi:hypothetical protein
VHIFHHLRDITANENPKDGGPPVTRKTVRIFFFLIAIVANFLFLIFVSIAIPLENLNLIFVRTVPLMLLL